LAWRYASTTDRPASMIVNGTEVGSLDFPTTGDWSSWGTATTTADLADGENSIRLEALSSSGLANIDSLTVTGIGATPGTCGQDANTVPDSELIGWASVSDCGPQGTTGGGDGNPTVTVTSGGELQSALTSSGALVIAVSGKMSSPGGVSDVRDKTLIGIDNAEITGGFVLSNSQNVIIKNIKFSDGSDDTFELTGCECVWFDHCEFSDGKDGNLDIVRGSDFVTVSWSRFYYTRGHSHMFSNLCGNSQPRDEDDGRINITFHHNWWGAGVRSRSPRVRYGKVHVFNNYYHYEKVENDGGQSYCIGAGYKSKLLVENNYFDNSKKPIQWMSDEGTAEVVETGNTFVDSGGVVTRGDSFVPPYSYTMDPAPQIKDAVMAGAGVK
jgi:pectate lyase